MKTEFAKWPDDYAYLEMPWGRELVNITWPHIAVTEPDTEDKNPRAMMYHTDNPTFPYCDFWLDRQNDGTYRVRDSVKKTVRRNLQNG